MIYGRPETVELLFRESMNMPVVDAHTHIQDDLPDFTPEQAASNLSGTQAAFNRCPESVIRRSLQNRYLVRRLMTDPLHGLFYSWFAEIAEGAAGTLDALIRSLENDDDRSRRAAAAGLCAALRDSRNSEYAEWLRTMFSFYFDAPPAGDPLDVEQVDALFDAVSARRNSPELAEKILRDHRIAGYVTSLENRCGIPADPAAAKPGKLDLSYSFHPHVCNMFDAHYLVWPEGATDFGLFLGGHKFEAEKYLLNLEQMLGTIIETPEDLRRAVDSFFRGILWSPVGNPASRVRYVNLFLPIDGSLNPEFDPTAVGAAIRFHKASLHGNALRQTTAFVTHAMLDTLDDLGREMRANGEEYGSCLQIAMGVTYFMDAGREIQSFPVYRPGLAQAAYPLWASHPDIHFEYILAHRQLCEDFSGAAKQVHNLSVGPWWHLFRRRPIARLLYDQLSMGPVKSIACGFTDARFVEMLAAKYGSLRRAVSMALAELVDDPSTGLYRKPDRAVEIMRDLLYRNPVKVHHLPQD